MRTIHKFEVHITQEAQTIDLPKDHRFLAAEYIIPKRLLGVWMEVPADLTMEKVPHQFRVFCTGDGIPANYKYLATCIDQYLPEAYHLYQVVE
ncbi:MAG: hypothetical protein CSA49_04730 [Gammaproteobacteria bacterium]|nr:MAG: hypothetical protein CSA49_04730 [Gammaproteobacteria bacterium]